MVSDTGTLGTHGDLSHAHKVPSFRGMRLRQEQSVPGLSLQPRLGVPQLDGDRLPSGFLLCRSLIMHVHQHFQNIPDTAMSGCALYICSWQSQCTHDFIPNITRRTSVKQQSSFHIIHGAKR
jgi:hypothetical protein